MPACVMINKTNKTAQIKYKIKCIELFNKVEIIKQSYNNEKSEKNRQNVNNGVV